MAERMISDVLTKADAALEMTLRPAIFSDFTGQIRVKERLEIAVQAAQAVKFHLREIGNLDVRFAGKNGRGGQQTSRNQD